MTKHASSSTIAFNRRALFDYAMEERLEAGLVLLGSEVKSLRAHNVSLAGAFIIDKEGALYVQGAHISPYAQAAHFGHDPLRLRKLLLHQRQYNRLVGQITRKGMTLIPLSLYFNAKGRIKVEIGLASGRKKEDKRELLKERQWKRDQHRLLRTNSQEKV